MATKRRKPSKDAVRMSFLLEPEERATLVRYALSRGRTTMSDGLRLAIERIEKHLERQEDRRMGIPAAEEPPEEQETAAEHEPGPVFHREPPPAGLQEVETVDGLQQGRYLSNGDFQQEDGEIIPAFMLDAHQAGERHHYTDDDGEPLEEVGFID